MQRLWWAAVLVGFGSILGCDDGGSGDDPPDATDMGATDGFIFIPGSDATPPPVEEPPTARYDLADEPATTPLGAIPFPSNLYQTADGRLDLRGFPRPNGQGILGTIIDTLEAEVRGFGTSATMFLSFDGRVDVTALPQTPAASMTPGSTLFVVDVDPEGDELGRKWPVSWRYDESATAFTLPFALRIRMVEGIALRPERLYALVVTTGAADAAPGFVETIGDARPEGALGAAWDVHRPLATWLSANNVSAATASVFRTQDPVGELFQARDFIQTLAAPELLSIESLGVQQQRFELFDGVYRAPRFQEGVIPYSNAGEGAIRFDADGNPIIQGQEDLRFALSVPLGEMPEGGWPLVLYAHGTGGNYQSFIRGTVASVLARNGLAVLAIDQIHHGTRDNGRCAGQTATCVQILYFNFLVPRAGRDNTRQAALDYVSLLRFAKTLDIAAGSSTEGNAARIDPERVMFMGHSQGGLNGPLLLAIEPELRGGMLSGAGSTIAISIEQKTRPVNINQLVRAALLLAPGDPLDRWHPTLSMLQTFIEASDAVNYGRFWFDEPAPGHLPKSIFMTVGLLDEFTPPDAIFALAAAGRVPIIEPVAAPIEALELLDIQPAGLPPYRGNVAGGEASAGLAQYPDEGHFVIFDVVSAQQRYARFLKDLSERAIPQIF